MTLAGLSRMVGGFVRDLRTALEKLPLPLEDVKELLEAA